MGKSDRDLLSELYDRFGRSLYRYLAVLLSNADCAEDTLQEVFLRLLRACRRDPDALSNRFYVFKVARNEAFRALSLNHRRPATGQEAILRVRDARTGSQSERAAVQDAMNSLPAEQREVVHLKIYMNMSFAEIADFVGVPLNTAASRYRYALEKLRGLLAEEEQ